MQIMRIHTFLLTAFICSLPIQGCKASLSSFSSSPSANVRADAGVPSDSTGQTDEVTEWTQIMLKALIVANQNAGQSIHSAAIVEASVFDAVNGIKGHYSYLHVPPNAPKGASARAAAVQAAYVSLVHLFPAQKSTFDTARATSLAAILDVNGGANLHESVQDSVNDGVAWGQQVADATWAWRVNDGFSTVLPPFLGSNAVGQWRPTPTAFAPGATPQLATTNTWVITSQSQFRPAGPPALSSPLYTQVYNETKIKGSKNSPVRTADQTLYALFWQSATATYWFNNAALQLLATQDMTLLDHARLFAAMNVAMGDAEIACWDAKYHYVFWRPVTAINLGDTDPNPNTIADPNWAPLITTPPHPEYPSAHSCFSSSAVAVLVAYFGNNNSFTLDSYAMPGVVRSFSSFDDALDEIENARIYGGIHFRTATADGRTLGTAVGNYILQNAMLPGHGNGSFDDRTN